MRFLVLIVLAGLSTCGEAQSSEPPPDLVLEAGHCLAAAGGDWFGLSKDHPSELELGVSSGSGSDSDSLYLIDYTTPTHTRGFAFAFLTHGKGSHRELVLQFRIPFQQTDDGTDRVRLVEPPLGGLSSNNEIPAAIRRVGFHTWKVPVADLQNRTRSVSCGTSNALR